MANHQFRCVACRRLRVSRVEGQRYCGRESCQKARKNAWRRQKYATDADYRANQAQSTKAWLDSVGGAARYHQQYRKRRSQRKAEPPTAGAAGAPVEKTRPEAETALVPPRTALAQPKAALQTGTRHGANSDAGIAESPVKTGRYLLVGVDGTNSDAVLVEITAVSEGYG